MTIWHTARILDVFLTQDIEGKDAAQERWQTSGWSATLDYDPRGIGTSGWGAVTGYTEEEVKNIPEFDADSLKAYFAETTQSMLAYLETVTGEDLRSSSKGYDGKQTNYFWVRHSIFHLTLHLGEILAIQAMYDRQNASKDSEPVPEPGKRD